MSRKLKHSRSNHVFWIKIDRRPELERVISQCVDDHCVLRKKYMLKGHTKENDIKRIDKDIKLTRIGDYYHVTLGVHIHHYSAVLFEVFNFYIDLVARLGIEPGSVTVDPPQEVKPEQKAEQKVEVTEGCGAEAGAEGDDIPDKPPPLERQNAVANIPEHILKELRKEKEAEAEAAAELNKQKKNKSAFR